MIEMKEKKKKKKKKEEGKMRSLSKHGDKWELKKKKNK
jgi:hypothetical protein